jgi:hypothetical protein
MKICGYQEKLGPPTIVLEEPLRFGAFLPPLLTGLNRDLGAEVFLKTI